MRVLPYTAQLTICRAPPRKMANTSSTTKPAMLRTRPIPWVMLLANSSSCMAERVGRISMLDPIFRCWDGRRNRQMVMGSINGFYERRVKRLGGFGSRRFFAAKGAGCLGVVAAAVEPRAKSPRQKDCNYCCILQRFANIGFHEPVVVDYSGYGAQVDCAMEHLPAAAAEAANPAGCGGDG